MKKRGAGKKIKKKLKEGDKIKKINKTREKKYEKRK